MSTMTATQTGQLRLYVKYSSEPPHLPIAVADSAGELAEKTGMTKASVYSSLSHKRPTFAKVIVEEDE